VICSRRAGAANTGAAEYSALSFAADRYLTRDRSPSGQQNWTRERRKKCTKARTRGSANCSARLPADVWFVRHGARLDYHGPLEFVQKRESAA
jgi:hypothetical protein